MGIPEWVTLTVAEIRVLMPVECDKRAKKLDPNVGN